MSNLTILISNASSCLSNPSSPTQARKAANNALQNLWTRDANTLIQSVNTILTDNNYDIQTKFHSLIAVRELFLRRHQELSSQLLQPTLSFLLTGLFNSNTNTTPATITRTLTQTVAVLLKLSLLQQQQPLLTQVLQMTPPSTTQLNILVNLLQQLSRPHGGLTLEIHEQCHTKFMGNYLNRAMEIAVTVVSQISNNNNNNNTNASSSSQELISIGLKVLSEVLGWDFKYHGSTTITSTKPKLQPPLSWRSSIIAIGAVLIQQRDAMSMTQESELRVIDDCLLNLSGAHGDIFQQPDSQALFVNNLLRGVMHVTRDVEAVHMSSEIIQRALTHSSVAVLSLLPNNGDVLLSIFNMMHTSLQSLGTSLSSGASLEDVDLLGRGIDNMLSCLAQMLIKLQSKKARIHQAGGEDDPMRMVRI